MVHYLDDPVNGRRTVKPKYIDTYVGTRRTLSGKVVLSPGSTTPDPETPPPPVGNKPIMFVWSGVVTESQAVTTLGQKPQGWCRYVQRNQLGTMVRDLTAVASQGLHLHVGCGAASDKTAFPEGSRELMLGLANKTAFAVDFWTTYLQNLNTVARAHPGVIVKAAGMVEPETGWVQGAHGSTSVALGEPTSGTAAQRAKTLAAIGRFHAEWFNLARVHAPLIIPTLWIGGTGLRNTERNLMFDAMGDGEGPGEVLTDPYNNNKDLTERPSDTWRPFVNAFRATGGAHYRHWQRWGTPPIGLGETGIAHHKPATATRPAVEVYTDAEMVAWLVNVYDDAVTMGLTQVNYFNSSGPNGVQAIINAEYPRAAAALSGEITQAKRALAA